MTPIDAYKLALRKIDELKDSGINVVITPSRSRNKINLIEKYNQPERIPPEKWVNVSFEILDKGQSMRIHDAARYLGMCGIKFDTGGCCHGRDWELDWSFKYTGKEDEEWEDASQDVEDMINDLLKDET